MAERLFGIETEYGFAPGEPGDRGVSLDRLMRRLIDTVSESVPSVPDLGSAGVFTQNGSRFYIDAGHHPEWATAEVANPWDIVRYVQAGDRLLAEAVRVAGTQGEASRPMLLKNNVCYVSGSTWGCHESVLHRSDPRTLERELVPFLITRVIHTGAGGFDPRFGLPEFVLSPRSTFIRQRAASNSTDHRPIFHTKDDPECGNGYRRLHLITGESLFSNTAAWLRSATLVMAVAMAEGGVAIGDGVKIHDPVLALQAIIHDSACGPVVQMADGSRRRAVDIQRAYLEQAEGCLGAGFMPSWAEIACGCWRLMLDRIESDMAGLSSTLDWAIKRRVFGHHLGRHGFDWEEVAVWNRALGEALGGGEARYALGRPAGSIDDADRWHPLVDPLLQAAGLPVERLTDFLVLRRELFEMDVRFSQVGPAGLFTMMDEAGVLDHQVPGVDNVEHAMVNPPALGRARIRGEVIRRVQSNRESFVASWDRLIDRSTGTVLDLTDPFETGEQWAPLQPSTLPRRVLGGGRWLPTRDEALRFLLRGDYVSAENALLEVLEAGQDRVSTLTHLARVFVVSDRVDDARPYIDRAWAERADAAGYVVGRTLWFRLLFAFMDGSDARPLLGRLKALFEGQDPTMDWTMEPVMHYIRGHVDEASRQLLGDLVRVLSGACPAPDLNVHPLWRETDPIWFD